MNETRKLQPDLENIEQLKPAEQRQIGFRTHLYPTYQKFPVAGSRTVGDFNF